VGASLTAKFMLRCWDFAHIVRHVRNRRRAETAQDMDLERAARHVGSYWAQRVFLFSHKNQCLYDSLTLLHYLARDHLYPRWVFAVQARPFAAHCWIQHGDTVFNDTAEHVSGYTPIMVI
jgi:hypothetical protein